MGKLQDVMQSVVEEVDDALACGVVDLSSGMMMAVHHNVPYFTQSYLDAVAAAAVEMVRGKSVRRVEALLAKHRGSEVSDSFEEIFISSTNVFHFMKVVEGKGALVVLITKKTTNQGMGWASLRSGMEEIEGSLTG